MNARYAVNEASEAFSQQHTATLLCWDELDPPLDLRSGSYESSDKLCRLSHGTKNILAGLSMFWGYMKVVRRDRKRVFAGEYSDLLWARSALELTRLFERYGARFAIEGLEQLGHAQQKKEPSENQNSATGLPAAPGPPMAPELPAVFAANHMSTLETLTLCGYITPYMPTTFVVKRALAEGYFAPLICSRPYIALERKNPLEDLQTVLREGTEILESGRSVILFPQGTREPGAFRRSRFNSIAARLAAKAGVPLVPAALDTRFWGRPQAKWGKWAQYIPLLRPEQTVHFAFGPPIPALGRAKQSQRQALEFIGDKMRQWGLDVLD